MKHQFFLQGKTALTLQLKKEYGKYIIALETEVDSAELQVIKDRIKMLQVQLNRAESDYKIADP